MTELKLTELPNGQILFEQCGDNVQVSKMLCKAMIDNVELASIICGAIPTFLDETNRKRYDFCKQIMISEGSKNKKQ